jgi:hypothetical protein
LTVWRSALALALICAALAAPAVLSASAEAAPKLPDVTVRVTILKLEDLGNDLDSLTDADFFTVTRFDDGVGGVEEHRSSTLDGDVDPEPNTEWNFKANPSKGSVHVSIAVFDEDDGANGDDDVADVVPGDPSTVELDVKLRPCAISGNVSGSCSQEIVSSDGDKITFMVDVFLPTSTPGLRMQCLHTPLWPQPGDAVTITATALDGAAKPLAVADRVTIKYAGIDVATVNGASTTSYTFAAGGSQFQYECEAEDDGGRQAATTTRRIVRVGPESNLAVPVVMTGPSDKRIDVVVLADAGAYPPSGGLSSYQQPGFLADLPTALLKSFYGDQFALTKQNAFNFWIARSSGADVSWPAGASDCTVTAPEDWDRYGFAEVGWVFHDDSHRDCARGPLRLFGAYDGTPRVALHEAGHVPFGLADEYCCDGGYWQAGAMPNVFGSSAACQEDAPKVGRPASACRSLGATNDGMSWFTSDPAGGDTMVDNGVLRALDRRRWVDLIDRCVSKGGC